MSHLSAHIEDKLATIVLHNPPQNRLGLEFLRDFEDILEQVSKSDARAVLLKAEGPNFSFGGDIRPWPGMGQNELRALFERYYAVYNGFERLAIPTVAAVQGICFGGGFELVLRCDIVIAAASAKFGHPEQTIALTTLLGGVQRVAERAGRAFAAELAYTSQPVLAEAMFHRGIVNRVVADDALAAEAEAFARRLAQGPTRAHAAHKTLLRLWAAGGVQSADDALLDLSMPLFDTEDTKLALESAINALARGEPRPTLAFKGR